MTPADHASVRAALLGAALTAGLLAIIIAVVGGPSPAASRRDHASVIAAFAGVCLGFAVAPW